MAKVSRFLLIREKVIQERIGEQGKLNMKAINKNKAIRNILIFAILVNGLAWLGPMLGGTPAEPGLGFLVWGTAPIVSALIMRYGLRDEVDMGWKLKVRGNGRYYLLSLLAHPLIIAIIMALGLTVGFITLNDSFTMPAFISAMIPLAVIFFIFSIFEEVGWRGYLSPSVYRLNDRLLGHAIVGVIWASWHFPYMRELWVHTDEGMATLLPRFILGTVVFAVLYGEIRLRSNSVWPAVLMHWSGNTVANTLLAGFAGAGFITHAPNTIWLTSFGVEGALLIGIVALMGGFLYRHHDFM